ncbi:VOC family protein [Marinomonas mediterranea]|jgi:Predicted enzyme related to lactoylglutathione lyase|uniref:Glyoxalase/bleomycin resistance protein/dioxygenase n=1 Tax=Marinomonas mediterranea (strain ATCC 700492 / JCM 21426 / NBRC 103028 / MMB-1) TaxID=717774 RepID=F2JY63_MARM1|nr:VOC family protein [Marinomonas mediterranea]ADZ90799.1 Glyoxalase/bleomycin resistance protein/dioxygenase [Marinomonas mediterranea MMB-1]WCN08839.1 VOC family protein [Marinomonas mediterranea]WCN12884.1 VOC family protein [Marinomonas mediterranea]WCN16952.1 VOC family protein [Marinomonas mediterranea MMB-1]
MESNKINYVELPAKDLTLNKSFFEKAFGWSFQDFGTEYTAFENAGLDGGFFQADFASRPQNGAALVVLYSSELETTLERVKEYGGSIEQEIFEFPGGRRFHFLDPCGNEWAVWSKLA